MTSVKNQFRDGGCRSFAALAALESHIKLKEGVELDLSENNMEMRHGFTFTGERGYLKPREGRTRESDIPYLVNGKGPILEKDDPYTPMRDKQGEPSNYLTREQVDNLPIVTDKESVRYIMGLNLLKSINTEDITSESLNEIKKSIKENGAVVSNIYMAHDENSTFPYTNAKYYNREKFAYYADGKDDKYKKQANHAVAIVGWDDSFSKDNFITKPKNNGAWLVKDAQTEEFGDGGYFYVSYESVSMGTEPYVFTDVRSKDSFNGIYQHDEVAFSGYMEWNFLSDSRDYKTILFNKYTPNENGEILKEVGFYTTKKNAEYEVYLISDFESFKDEAEQLSADEEDEFYNSIQKYKILSGIKEQAGYHTIKLPESLNLENGKSFALGIWTKNSDKEDPKHKWDMVLEKKEIGKIGHKARIGKDETYAFTFDGFVDINARMPYIGNAVIKGYYKKKIKIRGMYYEKK